MTAWKNLTLNSLRHSAKLFGTAVYKLYEHLAAPSLCSLVRWRLDCITHSRKASGHRNLTPAASTWKRLVRHSIPSGSCYNASSSSTRTGPSVSRSDSIPLETTSPRWNSDTSREINRPSSSSPISTSRRWPRFCPETAGPYAETSSTDTTMTTLDWTGWEATGSPECISMKNTLF